MQTNKTPEMAFEESDESRQQAVQENAEDSGPALEELFAKLDRIMENMERRDISLEDSFRDYQEGIRLLEQCNSKIDRIEKKILVMNGDGGFDEFQ